MGSDEDLYIKMNSRGKPLTEFENFKARFEQDIRHSDRADEFARKIDGAWSDLLWPFRGDDDIVDDEFIRYIDFITEICELREGRIRAISDRLGPRARAVFGEKTERAERAPRLPVRRVRQVAGRTEHISRTFRAVLHVTAGRGRLRPAEGRPLRRHEHQPVRACCERTAPPRHLTLAADACCCTRSSCT